MIINILTLIYLNSTLQGAIYGMSQSIPDRSLVSEICGLFLDACYTTNDPVTENGSTPNGSTPNGSTANGSSPSRKHKKK